MKNLLLFIDFVNNLMDHVVQKIVKEIANKAQISKTVTPHILRHTFATLALQKNISLASVQKILGHDRLATTSIYLNFTLTRCQTTCSKHVRIRLFL